MGSSRFGGYEVIEALGKGGSGTVYRARGPAGEVALKVLSLPTKDALARFEREMRLQERLGLEEGFVPLLGRGDFAAGQSYFVMPLLRGGTLRERLRRGPLAVDDTVELGRQLAAALARAHGLGIVHRDLKPENVLFDESGRAFVSDLGLAKHFAAGGPGAGTSVDLTRTGTSMGTVSYAAPEQMGDAKAVGPAADVFALGAILHECLAGSPAFSGSTITETCAKVLQGGRDDLGALRAETPPWLLRVIERALAVDPARRYPDGVALARALRGEEAPRRRFLLASLGLAGLAVVAVAALVLVPRPPRPKPAPPPAPAAPASPARPARPIPPSAPPSGADPAAADRAIEEAKTCFDRAEYDRCVTLLDEALARDSSRAGEVLGMRSRAHYARRDYVRAEADATAAIERAPGSAVAFKNRAAARLERDDVAGALGDADRAIELDPKLVTAWKTRGMVHHRAGDRLAALEDYARALELDATVLQAWIGRSAIHYELGDYAGSIADCDRAIALAPQDPVGWVNRSLGKTRLGEIDGAIADLDRSIELDGKNAAAIASRAELLDRRGDARRALADYKRALELTPAAPDAERFRARVAALEGR